MNLYRRARTATAKHGKLIAYVAFTVAMTFGLWRSQDATAKANHAIAAVCEGQKNNRQVLIKLVVRAYNPASTGTLDLTQLPAYAGLTGATKEWVDQFQALIALGSRTTQGDENHNHVPDSIDELLAQKVC